MFKKNADLYELKMALFDNGKLEKFLLFIDNSNMTNEASGTFVASTNIQYLHTLIHGEALHQFNTLSDERLITTSENLKSIIFALGTYFFPANAISKQKHAMRH